MYTGNLGNKKNCRVISTAYSEVLEIIMEVRDSNCPIPTRIVRHFQTLDGQPIGKIDPLDSYKEIFQDYEPQKKEKE